MTHMKHVAIINHSNQQKIHVFCLTVLNLSYLHNGMATFKLNVTVGPNVDNGGSKSDKKSNISKAVISSHSAHVLF
jgi:hypothetical protein